MRRPGITPPSNPPREPPEPREDSITNVCIGLQRNLLQRKGYVVLCVYMRSTKIHNKLKGSETLTNTTPGGV